MGRGKIVPEDIFAVIKAVSYHSNEEVFLMHQRGEVSQWGSADLSELCGDPAEAWSVGLQ